MPSYIIIGAGILGASTAYHLTNEGEDVLLIDRNDPGQATNAAAGIICPWLTNRYNKAWYKLVEAGAKYYPKLVAQLKANGESTTGYHQVGAINVFDTDEKLDRKMEVALKRQASTPEMGEVTRLSKVETKKLFPPLKDVYGAVHISGAARVNGAELRDALIRGGKAKGLEFLNGDASLEVDDSKVTGVTVSGRSYRAEKVIVTGGVWSRQLLESVGLNFLVKPQKAQIVHLQMPDTDTSKWPIVLPPYQQYMLTFGNGKIVVGATQEDDVGLDNRITMSGVFEIFEKALKVAPGLASATYVDTKVGFRPFTPGHLPIIGQVPGYDGLYVANGLGASGLTSGPYLGKELARFVMNQSVSINIKDYDVANAFG
ncbi:NAD(P)/FAD-dependent oxidoreductase [Aquibacillus salsiterrae]|uniref:FAD-binding oxidoreductase n=1 Tax=Aquibacillus salsiterrae TaxID=2950439 RepID=A0A9X3WEC0_9BACI|nr:FAD-dependent oxidoreductase [Aquibacillus salsiterrae]MDC3417153.1 FAD-binding oxidoreductase [Aquibacillus salsiterrae]